MTSEFSVGDATKYQASIQGNTMRIGDLATFLEDWKTLKEKADNIDHIKIYAESLISIAKGKTEVNISGVLVARALLGIIEEEKKTMKGKIVSISCELDTDDYEFRDGWCLTCIYSVETGEPIPVY